MASETFNLPLAILSRSMRAFSEALEKYPEAQARIALATEKAFALALTVEIRETTGVKETVEDLQAATESFVKAFEKQLTLFTQKAAQEVVIAEAHAKEARKKEIEVPQGFWRCRLCKTIHKETQVSYCRACGTNRVDRT